jgi:hypothetical protein
MLSSALAFIAKIPEFPLAPGQTSTDDRIDAAHTYGLARRDLLDPQIDERG